MGRLSSMRRWCLSLMLLRLIDSLCSSSMHCHQLMCLHTLLRNPSTLRTLSVRLLDRFLMLWSTSTGEARSTSTWNLPTFLSALEDLLADQSKSNLPTLKLPRQLQAMELRSRAHTTLTMLLLRSLRRPRPILNQMSGLLVYSSMSSCQVNFHSRVKPLRRQRTTSSTSSSSLSICTRSAPWRAQGCSCGSSRRLPSDVHPLRRLELTGG